MAKKLAIPEDNREYPDYEYRPFPRWLGRDELGNDIVAENQADVAELTALVVFPVELGHNAKGSLIVANHPDEVHTKKSQVAKPVATPAGVTKVETETTKQEKTKKAA